MPKILQNIFSITNSQDKSLKIINICGHQILINLMDKNIKLTQKNYQKQLKIFQTKIKTQKLKVLFLINEVSKWKTKSLYNLMKNSEEFEPIIALNIADWQWELSLQDRISVLNETEDYFKRNNIKYLIAYNKTSGKLIDLKKFKPDIVFYQQPYLYQKIHNPLNVSKFALTYYMPYYVPNFWVPDLYWWKDFHRHLFRYYQPNEKWENYLKKYVNQNKKGNPNNILGIGHTMLDEFYFRKKEITPSNNYVIYAPHWSIKHEKNINEEYYSTFLYNHKEILEYAKNHPEFNWVFKPHPTLKHTLIKTEIMTEQEVDAYYNEWAKIGQCCYDSNYVDLFLNSKALITDCGSFTIEYLVTNKPLIHLLSKDYKQEALDFVQQLYDTNYKIHNNSELFKTLDEVLVNNNDYLKEYREKVLSEQTWLNECAAEKIIEDIKQYCIKRRR